MRIKDIEKVKQYQRLSSAILLKLNINREAKQLSTFMGDCTNRTNLVVVQQWLTEQDSSLEHFGREEIEQYSSRLKNVIDDFYFGY